MSTTALGPWRSRVHIGDDGPPGAIRLWPAFTAVVLTGPDGWTLLIVGPVWPERPVFREVYRVRSDGDDGQLLQAIRQRVDARQAAWSAWAATHRYEQIHGQGSTPTWEAIEAMRDELER